MNLKKVSKFQKDILVNIRYIMGSKTVYRLCVNAGHLKKRKERIILLLHGVNK